MPTRTEEQAFLAPILARYRDDGPRLIFADFLDESSDPADRARADLIRVQCTLPRLPADHPRRPALLQQQADLLHRFRAVWAAPLRGLADPDGCEWRRGLLDGVTVDAATFLARGAELFHRAPVRRVRLSDANRHVVKLAECPYLANVRELDLSACGLGNGGVRTLLWSPYLGRVEFLDLSFNGLDDGGARLVATATTLPGLRRLLLTDNCQIGSDGVRALAGSPHLGGLTALDVSANDVGDAGVRAVAESRHLTRLHTFRVHANHIGDAGAAVLASSPLLGRMLAADPTLDLRQNAIGAPGARALAESPYLARATGLDLSGNYLCDDGLSALAFSPHLGRLRRLVVRQNHVGDAGAVALAHSPLMGRLTALDLSANRLTRKGVDTLWVHRRDWRTVIEVGGNFVSDGEADSGPPHTLGPEVGQILSRLAPGGA